MPAFLRRGPLPRLADPALDLGPPAEGKAPPLGAAKCFGWRFLLLWEPLVGAMVAILNNALYSYLFHSCDDIVQKNLGTATSEQHHLHTTTPNKESGSVTDFLDFLHEMFQLLTLK